MDAVMLISAMYVQIYRSVLLSSRHHKTDQAAQSSSPMSAAKDERRTRREKTAGNWALRRYLCLHVDTDYDHYLVAVILKIFCCFALVAYYLLIRCKHVFRNNKYMLN